MATRPTMALAAPKSTEIMPGTVLRGRMYNSSGKVSEGNEMESKYHYLMNWGSQLIGVNKYTRAQLDYHVALAWEHDHWYVRCLKAAVDAAPLIGEMGRHPLSPPWDQQRFDDFQKTCMRKHSASPLAHIDWNTLVRADACCRATYIRIKRDTNNMFGHALRLHCAVCFEFIPKEGMLCCSGCRFHMRVCVAMRASSSTGTSIIRMIVSVIRLLRARA